MDERQAHAAEVTAFLRAALEDGAWTLALPPGGSGHETYVARAGDRRVFVKLGAHVSRVRVLARRGLTPEVLAAGTLSDGTAILAQPYLASRMPSQHDFRARLDQFAAAVRTLHECAEVRASLPPVPSEDYRDAAWRELTNLRGRWEAWRADIPAGAEVVEEGLARLAHEIATFSGSGLVASHNDPCNGNWLVTADGRVYLLDLESMALDDPARDLGALLWWYYPPPLRPRFLRAVGRPREERLAQRMRVRMAMHCLHIALPRAHSYDTFRAAWFAQCLEDFRAVLDGRENPQGYAHS